MTELQSLSRLAVDTLDRVVTTPVQQTHRAIARRAFTGSGPGAVPARVAHDGISALVYGALRSGATVAGAAASAWAARREAAPLESSPAGRAGLSAVNALIGDLLEEEGSDLAIEMAVRHGGRALEPSSEALAAALPGATPRVALFVHGLGENEDAWRLGGRPPYGARMAAELGHTPLYLRYNSGLHVSENGRRLSQLLDRLVTAWPVEVEELVLVGHSMGGLMLRAACHEASRDDATWVEPLRQVIYLGAPHLGAPLEQMVNAASYALRAVPETRAFAGILETRSAGIKDLRYGYVCDEDWDGHDADALLRNTGTDVPLIQGPRHCFVAACAGRDPERRLTGAIGDLLVGVASASGPRGCDIALDQVRRLPGLNHFQLLNHPRVYAEIRDWVRRR